MNPISPRCGQVFCSSRPLGESKSLLTKSRYWQNHYLQKPDHCAGAQCSYRSINKFQTDTISKKMEVHHHPNKEKKKFKEYFLEFLMIFLAVTMGFFAENIRETYHDKERVHQLTISLINDLKADTARLAFLLTRSDLKIKKMDSLCALLRQPKDKINNLDLQRLVISASLNFNFVPSSGTISELKSTGVLRLFLGTEIPKLINGYESVISNTMLVENREIDYGRKYIE